jgi:cytochrome c oxidase cbb3-type subunit III
VMRVCFFLFFGLTLASAQTSNPYANDPKAAEAGNGFFRIYCAACHGREAQGGGRGPDLTRGSFTNGDQDADLFRVISSGVPGTDMAAFGERVGGENIWRIIAFIRSKANNESKISGNSASGEALFWGKGTCGNCHTVGARGNRMGPDLTLVGRTRGVTYLRAAVAEPDKDIAPGYQTVTVVTREGKTISGIQKAIDDFSVEFMDLQGNYYSFDRGALQSVKQENRSLMPAYDKVFSEAEMNDLLAYLLTLRGPEVKQ